MDTVQILMFLGIDYGQKRIGLALGSQYPRGIGTIEISGSFDNALEKIAVICKDNEVERVIMGIPVRTSGEPGELVAEIKTFGKELGKKTSIPVDYEEEGYTSVQAEEELRSRGVDTKKELGKIDELAAVLILEQYIGKNKEN